eukprot:TRINITY_DN6189_c0_g2_i2.p2 TRINITY_DN6189_c0_g2~~TRINITY_DN6189_c0_g2_i2.p2  ORF type:complete len:215 (+),score=-9.54 TRINITY_DN6189_c0_g2_i2:2-646(+)
MPNQNPPIIIIIIFLISLIIHSINIRISKLYHIVTLLKARQIYIAPSHYYSLQIPQGYSIIIPQLFIFFFYNTNFSFYQHLYLKTISYTQQHYQKHAKFISPLHTITPYKFHKDIQLLSPNYLFFFQHSNQFSLPKKLIKLNYQINQINYFFQDFFFPLSALTVTQGFHPNAILIAMNNGTKKYGAFIAITLHFQFQFSTDKQYPIIGTKVVAT